jgi:hypothetical protein
MQRDGGASFGERYAAAYNAGRLGRSALLRVVAVAGQHQADTDALVREAIANARDVGAALGINAEAAAKRYGPG